MKNNVIKELNTFLEGNFMAIHAYDKYIHHIDDVEIKQVLQRIQQNHKMHATMIAERIQNLGGIAVDDVSMMGNVAEFLSTLKGSAHDPIQILKDTIVGEERGIEKSKKILDGDLDPESLVLVKHILDADQQHIDSLNHLLH